MAAPPPPPVQCGATASYVADADAWIDEGSPLDNKGSDSTLKVMSKVGSNLRALIRFAMPEGIPEGCVVQSATLRLFAASSAAGRTLEALQVAGPWSAAAVTWANQPATAGVPASTSSGAGYREWNVTAQVQAMLVSGGNHGFLIRDAVEGQDAEQQFHSADKGESPPQLIVTYAATGATTTTASPPTTPSTTVPPPAPVQCGAVASYVADADAWINEGSPSDNKGSDSILKVMSKSGANLRGLVRFAMPSRVPDGCVVQSATMQMFAASSSGGRTLQALQVNGAWSEGAVTWSNQPATTGVAATATSGAGYRQWDVTAQVQAMLASGANHGFLIRDAVEGQDAEQQFHSREKGELVPQLIVTYAPAPTADDGHVVDHDRSDDDAATTTITSSQAPTTTPAPPSITTTVEATTTTPATTTTSVPAVTTTVLASTTTALPTTTPTTMPEPTTSTTMPEPTTSTTSG